VMGLACHCREVPRAKIRISKQLNFSNGAVMASCDARNARHVLCQAGGLV
jgi:hypothetical protein